MIHGRRDRHSSKDNVSPSGYQLERTDVKRHIIALLSINTHYSHKHVKRLRTMDITNYIAGNAIFNIDCHQTLLLGKLFVCTHDYLPYVTFGQCLAVFEPLYHLLQEFFCDVEFPILQWEFGTSVRRVNFAATCNAMFLVDSPSTIREDHLRQ